MYIIHELNTHCIQCTGHFLFLVRFNVVCVSVTNGWEISDSMTTIIRMARKNYIPKEQSPTERRNFYLSGPLYVGLRRKPVQFISRLFLLTRLSYGLAYAVVVRQGGEMNCSVFCLSPAYIFRWAKSPTKLKCPRGKSIWHCRRDIRTFVQWISRIRCIWII